MLREFSTFLERSVTEGIMKTYHRQWLAWQQFRLAEIGSEDPYMGSWTNENVTVRRPVPVPFPVL